MTCIADMHSRYMHIIHDMHSRYGSRMVTRDLVESWGQCWTAYCQLFQRFWESFCVKLKSLLKSISIIEMLTAKAERF